MNRRIAPPQPFAPVDSTETARALARGSAWAFWIWAGVGLMQAGLVWFLSAPEQAEFRGATTVAAGEEVLVTIDARCIPAAGYFEMGDVVLNMKAYNG